CLYRPILSASVSHIRPARKARRDGAAPAQGGDSRERPHKRSTPDHPALVSASPVPHQPAGYGLRETIPAAARPYQAACLAVSVADVRTSLRRSRHTDCQAYEAAHFWPAIFPGLASFPGCASTWLAVR